MQQNPPYIKYKTYILYKFIDDLGSYKHTGHLS